MNDQNKPVSSVEATANPIPSPGRRRLVKGAMLATPAVMTLMSGRLMATTSAICSEKEVFPQAGWIDEQEHELVIENNQLGYWTTGQSGEQVFNVVSPDVKQTAFHSINCWASFPHT